MTEDEEREIRTTVASNEKFAPPWEADIDEDTWTGKWWTSGHGIMACSLYSLEEPEQVEVAKLIASSVNAVPRLLAALDATRAQIATLVEAGNGVLVHRPKPQAFADLEAAITDAGPPALNSCRICRGYGRDNGAKQCSSCGEGGPPVAPEET